MGGSDVAFVKKYSLILETLLFGGSQGGTGLGDSFFTGERGEVGFWNCFKMAPDGGGGVGMFFVSSTSVVIVGLGELWIRHNYSP
jgi:hypothetical protein